MISLFLGGALGLAVQPLQAGSMQASPLAPAAEPAVAVAPVAEAPPATAVAAAPEFVQPEAPVAPTAVAVAPTAVDPAGTQPTIATETCVSLQPGTSDYWCSATCASSVCPETMCKCGDGAQQQAAAKVDAAIASHQENEQKVKDT